MPYGSTLEVSLPGSASGAGLLLIQQSTMILYGVVWAGMLMVVGP